jgi:hypothetical protein
MTNYKKCTLFIFGLSILVVAILGFPPLGHSTTGFLVGERTQGMSKLCFYDVLGETYPITLSAISLCPLSYDFITSPPNPHANTPPAGGKAGFLKGERTQGLSKVCFYDVLGETYAISVSAVSLCPLSYRF